MKTHDATEEAYKNGYEKGYEDGKRATTNKLQGMNKKIRAIISEICGLLCIAHLLFTADPRWVIAGAIFRVAASLAGGSNE